MIIIDEAHIRTTGGTEQILAELIIGVCGFIGDEKRLNGKERAKELYETYKETLEQQIERRLKDED